jgi:hypothetical protein
MVAPRTAQASFVTAMIMPARTNTMIAICIHTQVGDMLAPNVRTRGELAQARGRSATLRR